MADQEIIYRIKVVGDDAGKSKLAELTTQLQEVGKQRNELLKLAKSGQQLTKDEANQLEQLNSKYVSLTKQKRDYNSEVARSVKQAEAEVKSLAGMRADIASMRAEYEKLAPASAKGKQLAGAIALLQKEINDADFATKNFRGNVGNYMGAVDTAVESTTKSFGELKQELRELRNMSFAGKTQEEIAAIQAKIGELGEEMDDMRAGQKAAAVGLAESIAGTSAVMSGTVQGVTALSDVFGVQGGVLGELQEKMLSLMAVTQALFVIEDAIGKKTVYYTALKIKDTAVTGYQTVANWANATSLGAQAAATEAAAVITSQATIGAKAAAAAQWLWNAAILANPIVAIVAAVAALTAGIYLLVKGESESEVRTRLLNEELERLNKTMQRTKDNQQFMTDYAQAIGMSTERLREMERAHIAVNRAQAWQEMNALIKLGTERTQEQTDRVKVLAGEIVKLKERELVMDAQTAKAKADQAREAAEQRAADAKTAEEAERKEAEAAYKQRLADKAKADKEAADEKIKAELEYQKNLDAALDEYIKEQEEVEIADAVPIEEDPAYHRRLAAIDSEAKYFADRWGQTYDQQAADLKLRLEQGLITQREYNARMTELDKAQA